MDIQLISIVFIFLTLIFLEFYDKKENFFNPSPFLEKKEAQVPYSVNLQKDRNFGNFGTFGAYPPNPICPSCSLNINALTFPYRGSNDLGDENDYGKVATTCSSIFGKNYDDLNRPFLVAGRTNGRPRQCRRIV